ncbi:MAG: hypothetical protein FWE90_10910 [Defluviitaleaceae bacterium]|nr:hypothetical protein [Defluviitaleaceae bacterium]
MAKNPRLTEIVTKFAESGWDVIDAPAKEWLKYDDCPDSTKALIKAVTQANEECGSCGCEMDPLYKESLELLAA